MACPLVQVWVRFPMQAMHLEFINWMRENEIVSESHRTGVGCSDCYAFDVDDAERVVEWLKARGLEQRK